MELQVRIVKENTHFFPQTTGLDEDSEIADFMWYFMDENRESRQDSNAFTSEKRSTDSESVGEIMSYVCSQVEITGNLGVSWKSKTR